MMLALFLLFVAGAGAVDVYTTAISCLDDWPYASQWRDSGYSPKCIEYDEQIALIGRHCGGSMPPLKIQASDISRLLVLYENGGWFVDADVEPTPLSATIQTFEESTFGLESNFPTGREAQKHKMMQRSLAMWSFFGIRHDPRLKAMACNLTSLAASTRRKRFESLRDFVHRTTGPMRYTKLWGGRKLAVDVFGCGQAHSDSPPCSSSTCWGCHGFKGSWIPDKGVSDIVAWAEIAVVVVLASVCLCAF